MRMSERPLPPPEGSAITAALKKSGLSAREAARRASISEGRWRQIASGYQNPRSGVYIEVTAPAETLARMARVVKLAPEAMEAAGRADAAEVMRRDLEADDSGRDLPDLDTLVPESPMEKALLAIYRADRQATAEFMKKLMNEVQELRSTVDRMAEQKPDSAD